MALGFYRQDMVMKNLPFGGFAAVEFSTKPFVLIPQSWGIKNLHCYSLPMISLACS